MEGDGLAGVLDVDGELLVEGVGAFVICVGGLDCAFFAGGDGLFGPLDIGASARGHDGIDDGAASADVGHFEGAGLGTVLYADGSEIVNLFIEADKPVGGHLCRSEGAEGREGHENECELFHIIQRYYKFLSIKSFGPKLDNSELIRYFC